MTTLLEQIGSELSFIRTSNLSCDWNAGLHHCQTIIEAPPGGYTPTDEDDLLYEVLLKGLQRGPRPPPSYYVEQRIVSLYGASFNLTEKPKTIGGSIAYSVPTALKGAYASFTDLVDPWNGNIADVEFDPQNPQNEREYFARLIARCGNKLAHCIYPQAPLADVLDPKAAKSFAGQRGDFLVNFPNGRSLMLEPGDHSKDPNQIRKDKQRDRAFKEIGIETERTENEDITSRAPYDRVEAHLRDLKALTFLQNPAPRSGADLASNYLFLLPTLLARIERILLQFFLKEGLIHRSTLNVGIIERDLECAELVLTATIERIGRLAELYGFPFSIPAIALYVQRNPAYRFGDLSALGIEATPCTDFTGVNLDLILDVGIKCNALTKPAPGGAPFFGATRLCYAHNRPVRFGYLSKPRSISLTAQTDKLLDTFVNDYFRKRALREGQGPILHNILTQKSTIGLLPTSAGKSLCYQLAALLTPGTTIVVAPLVALMEDQVQGLEQCGIERVLAWHAGTKFKNQNAPKMLSEVIIMLISPERLQRPRFRAAMNNLNAADIYINYAVIDEAHCVSMWGHEFRPAYLTLEKNFRDYCSFQGRVPVLVALTGTASQLVLIDLKRELNISDMAAIIRPKSFNRPELHFNLVRCKSGEKEDTLEDVKVNIAKRLGIQSLDSQAYGIVFSYFPKELWELFGQHVGNAKGHVRSVINGASGVQLRYGMYTGSAPKDTFKVDEWAKYKQATLKAFKRGKIRMLFGNTAVSVGIDNENLNYVINYRMPQSLEAYYQQCGRAGRSGQHSECFLIFSDDAPQTTTQWLATPNAKMPKRPWDDLNTVSYFHENSFPGVEDDIKGALLVFKNLFAKVLPTGLVSVPQYLTPNMSYAEAERTERYLSYWLILGVITDYEVEGMSKNTTYHIRRHPIVEEFLQNKIEAALEAHFANHFQEYLSRYRPTSTADVGRELRAQPGKTLRERCIRYLVTFIYNQIEYQRRAAIGTMLSFCNQNNTNPDRLRARIKAYFDTSPKFSAFLLVMADAPPDFALVDQLLDKIAGFDDVEHLYWETRRLLDERFRPDWAAVNLFAITYREKAAESKLFFQGIDQIIQGLKEDVNLSAVLSHKFITSLINAFKRLDDVFGQELSSPLVLRLFKHLYTKYRMEFTGLIDSIDITPEERDHIRLHVANLQLKEITNANYSRITG
jgi:ATP-dependent DNA helicase RecQ